MTEKKFNVQTIIDNCGFYMPLCFKVNGRVIKYDYDLELYCDILKRFAQDKSDYIGTKSDFCFMFYKYVYEKLDDKKYDAMFENSSDEVLKNGREASDTIYLSTHIPELIGEYVETSIRFKDDHLYCYSYYCQQVVDVGNAVIMYIYGGINYYLATKVAIDHELMGKPILGIDD